MMRSLMLVLLMAACFGGDARAADRPNNPVGVHLMIHDARSDENIDKHTAWARRVCGPWGYVKIFEYGITPATAGPSDSLVKMISTLYERELIPVLRLGGGMKDGVWQRPADTPDGTFGDIAKAFKRVVEKLPRSDQCPLYIEVWNEANLGLEWSGRPRPADFAKFYVRAAKAIRSIGDERIKIAPGAMSPGGEYNSLRFIDAMCEAEPAFVSSFDYWATHPYPGGTPPEQNIHDQTTTMQFACIDLWIYELERLADHGCDVGKLGVIGTETGYRYGQGGGNPIVDKQVRADYHLRAFRDYWMKWPEVLGMCIWDFSNPFEKENDNTWVHADSTADEAGWPSMPTLDYEYVAALAKPTSDYGCASGRLVDSRTKAGIPGVEVTLVDTDLSTTTDRFGNFILSPIVPDERALYLADMKSNTHSGGRFGLKVEKGKNVLLRRESWARAFATLRGKVVNTQTGEPLADAMVTAEPGGFGTRSNRAGVFEFAKLPHGYYEVTVAKDGSYPHRQSATLLAGGQTTEHTYRLGPGREATVNLVSNGGFERAEPDAGIALGWGGEGEVKALALDGEMVYAGDRAQIIKAVPGSRAGIIQWTGYTTITPGERYRLQCWLRTAGVRVNAGKGARLAGTVVTNPHKKLMEVRGELVLTGDQPWTLVTADFTAPPDAGRVSLEVELEADAGTCWADEAAVLPLE